MSSMTRLDQLMRQWEEGTKRSPLNPPTAEELCRDCPEFLAALRQRIADRMQWAARETRPEHPPASLHPTPGQPAPRRNRNREDSFPQMVLFPVIPGFEIIHELGRGGMGIVYKARQTGLNRIVAIKMILAGAHATEKALTRFQKEAEAVARLDHPNIVHIWDRNSINNCPYFALEYTNAGNLDLVLAHGPLAPRQAVTTLLPVVHALQHAHEQGIIHRDLKPANILLHHPGGPPKCDPRQILSQLVPKLTDFGLAKELTSSENLTKTGVAIGTPNYMSPEQALAQRDRIGPATDIYGLGALLYEMLVGKPPFDAPSDLEVLQQVVYAPPTFPKRPGDREWTRIGAICMRCLAKQPEQRYPSAAALAADLERFLENKPLETRLDPAGSAERLRAGLNHWSTPYVAFAILLLVMATEFVLHVGQLPLSLTLGFGILLIGLIILRKRNGAPREATVHRTQPGPATPMALPTSPPTPAAVPLPPLKVGLLYSLTGTMAISEGAVLEAALLVIDEINKAGGVLGREIVPIVVDGCSDSATFARQAEHLIRDEEVCVLFGCWTSDTRRMVRPVVEKHQRLLLYPVQYEGLEQSPYIFYLGAAPNQQLLPAVEWCVKHLGKRRFYLIGSDYVFPHAANYLIKDMLARLGAECVGEEYLPLGSTEVTESVERIQATQPEMILNTINGDTNVAFFRALRRAGITPQHIPTMSFSISEQELRSMNPGEMVGDYAACNYFQSLDSEENRAFLKKLHDRYGPLRVATDPMEATYCAVHLWAQAVSQAGSADGDEVRKALRHQSFVGPGGLIRIDPETQHAYKVVRIGQIRADGHFDVVMSSERALPPIPYPKQKTRDEWEALVQSLHNQLGGVWARHSG